MRTSERFATREARRNERVRQQAGELARNGIRPVEKRRTRGRHEMCRYELEGAGEPVSWHGVASVRLKTQGCPVGSAERDLQNEERAGRPMQGSQLAAGRSGNLDRKSLQVDCTTGKIGHM